MAKWHVGRDGQQQAPMELADLIGAIETGQVHSTDLAWTDGMPEWKRVAEIPELSPSIPGAAIAAMVSGPGGEGNLGGQGNVAAGSPGGAPVPAAPLGVMSYQMPQSGSLLCTQTALDSLRGTKPWVRFMAILFFIVGGLCALGGLFGVVGGAFGGIRGNGGASFFILLMLVVYAVMTLIYLMLGLYLNRYATGIANLLTYRREDQLEIALENQRKFWKLVGWIVIVGFATYVLVAVIAIGLAIMA